MAERLDDFPFKSWTGKFPWDEWLDGSIWRLKRGEDFDITPAGFRAGMQYNANKRGGKVRTRREGENFVIQFIPNTNGHA